MSRKRLLEKYYVSASIIECWLLLRRFLTGKDCLNFTRLGNQFSPTGIFSAHPGGRSLIDVDFCSRLFARKLVAYGRALRQDSKRTGLTP
jgi:hypothetical protein